jgi:hypothetical protein
MRALSGTLSLPPSPPSPSFTLGGQSSFCTGQDAGHRLGHRAGSLNRLSCGACGSMSGPAVLSGWPPSRAAVLVALLKDPDIGRPRVRTPIDRAQECGALANRLGLTAAASLKYIRIPPPACPPTAIHTRSPRTPTVHSLRHPLRHCIPNQPPTQARAAASARGCSLAGGARGGGQGCPGRQDLSLRQAALPPGSGPMGAARVPACATCRGSSRPAQASVAFRASRVPGSRRCRSALRRRLPSPQAAAWQAASCRAALGPAG